MMAASDQVVDFENIYLGGKQHLTSGKLRMAAAGIGWKSSESGQVVTIPSKDMKRAQWYRVAKDHELRVQLKNGSVVKMDGFPAEKYDEVRRCLRDLYGIDVEQKELSVRGWNWGQTDFQGNSLFFNVANRPVMEIPLTEVTNTTLASKTEVTMEFKLPTADERDGSKDDQLVEMRFYLPGAVKATSPKDENGEQMDLDVEQDDKHAEDEDMSAAQQFHEVIKTKADLGQVAGTALVPFHELPFITPRGRYEVEMFDDFMRMHGKSYDYKISFKSIKHLFMLPKPDDIHVMFVLALDPPIRQGQTRYPFLVVQFVRDDDMEVTVAMTEDERAEKFGGRLKESYDAPSYEVVSSIFSIMTNVDLTTPQTFKSNYGSAGVKCSMKANEGFIYMLEDAFLFVPKPVTHLQYDDVTSVIFSRMSGGGASASRTFDMKVVTRKGGDFTFSNLNKEEHPLLEAFLRSKKVRVKNELAAEEAMLREMDTSSEDGDASPRRATAAGDDDSDESDDEDFKPEDESDVPEEFDENYDSSGSSSGGEEGGDGSASDEEEDEEED